MLENIFSSLMWLFLILIMVGCCIGLVAGIVILIAYAVKELRKKDGK